MIIGLFGFTFSHGNLGCQALTCSLLELLKRNLNGERVRVINFFDEKSLGYIPELFPEFEFAQKHLSIKNLSQTMKSLDECDVILDVTFGDGFSDIYFTRGLYRDIFVKWLAGKSKARYIMMPQTYGPFNHKTIEIAAGKAIKSADIIYARDDISAEYATKISHREVKTVTDLAFGLPCTEQKKNKPRKSLGLNISGLLWKGGFHQDNQFGLVTDYRKFCRAIIEHCNDNNIEVHLIPHVTRNVLGSNMQDDDFTACEEVNEEYKNVIIAPPFNSPYDVKDYISQMDVFVGARMHSTIAAFSTGVITIPFAYSRKFQGLYDHLGYSFYIDGTKTKTEESIQKALSWINSPAELITSQNRAMELLGHMYTDMELEIMSVITKKG